jgi:hypothetical protein
MTMRIETSECGGIHRVKVEGDTTADAGKRHPLSEGSIIVCVCLLVLSSRQGDCYSL